MDLFNDRCEKCLHWNQIKNSKMGWCHRICDPDGIKILSDNPSVQTTSDWYCPLFVNKDLHEELKDDDHYRVRRT